MAFGIDDAIAGVSTLFGKVIDKVFPDPQQAAQAKATLAQIDLQPDMEQIKINLVEAASSHPFVAGWRPFIGWVCGAAFAYKFILQPFLVFAVLQWNPHFPTASLPNLDWTELSAVLFGMLGLSYHRTQEKNVMLGGRK